MGAQRRRKNPPIRLRFVVGLEVPTVRVAIYHHDSCPESDTGKTRWVREFRQLLIAGLAGFEKESCMRAHAAKWAELARVSGCNCGAAEEIARRNTEEPHGQPITEA